LESSLDRRQGRDTKQFYNRGPVNRWDPFAEMERIQEEMNRMFRDSFNHRESFGKGVFGGAAALDDDLDLKETDNSYVITLDMSGLDKDKVGVEINENSVTVKGEYSQEKKEEGPGRYFSSSGYGSFLKTMPLPVDADTAKLKSEKKGDSFVITIPKK
jgi:HSP20 family protein